MTKREIERLKAILLAADSSNKQAIIEAMENDVLEITTMEETILFIQVYRLVGGANPNSPTIYIKVGDNLRAQLAAFEKFEAIFKAKIINPETIKTNEDA